MLAQHLTAKNLQAETDYYKQPNRASFERTYGWAWLLKLAEELHTWDDPNAKEWAKNLKPLTDEMVARYLAFLPKQTYPIRSGVHPNTAFGLAFALDYARAVDHKALRELIDERSRSYYAKDYDAPARWEPDGADFFSPSLMEADLMRRVLPAAEYSAWLKRYLPNLAKGEPKTLLNPATAGVDVCVIGDLGGDGVPDVVCVMIPRGTGTTQQTVRAISTRSGKTIWEVVLPLVASAQVLERPR